MDMRKLCDMLLEDPEISKIPFKYVFAVAFCVIKIINSGECFYQNDED